MSVRVSDYVEAIDHLPQGATLLVRDVSWEDYEQLLEDLSERSGFRVTYDRGTLQIMSPRPEHEKYKRFIERIIDELGDHLDLDIEPLGSSTWRKKEADRGTEADTCYYIANAKLIIGKSEIDLTVDPPPDLAVEIDRANDSLAKFPVYSVLRVPEIWRYDVKHMRVHMYELRGRDYVEIQRSRSFPMLVATDLAEFIRQRNTQGQKAAMVAFRRWLKKNVTFLD